MQTSSFFSQGTFMPFFVWPTDQKLNMFSLQQYETEKHNTTIRLIWDPGKQNLAFFCLENSSTTQTQVSLRHLLF